MDTAAKTGIGAGKSASKRVVQKTAETTGDLIENKIADKTTLAGKPKEKTKKVEEIYISPEQRQQIIDCFKHSIKIILQKYWMQHLRRYLVLLLKQSESAENRYIPSKQIKFKAPMLQSDLCDFTDSNNEYDKKLVFKNNTPFISFTSKINNTLIDNAEDLDTVMPMFNLLEYNKSYS